MIEYIHCGSNHFDRNIFMPIINESYPWIKPLGGMWSSPVDSENTWEDWCQENGFRLEKKGSISVMESEEEHQGIEIDEFTALRQELTGLEQEYNSTRQELFNRMRSYYNQSIASEYVKEDDLRRLLNKCEEIKQSYFQIQNKLMSKRPNNRQWSFRDSFTFSS